MEKTRVFIGSDHAGFELKEKLRNYLLERYLVVDKGTKSEESTDYPEYAHLVAKEVIDNENSLGVLICGSANGVCMTANKYDKIRAAIAWEDEIAALARTHNNANIICIPARFVSDEVAKSIVDAFFGAEFEGGRHERRINKMSIC